MMSLDSSGIERVRAFALAAGIGADGRAVNEPLSVLVKWRCQYQDKLYQVYVNGELAGATQDCLERMLIVPIHCLPTGSFRIEVYAVEPGEANIDFGGELEASRQAGRVRIGWLRSFSLPFEGRAEVYSDGGSGEIDYDNPVTTEAIELWPGWQDKAGFGLSRFGRSDFGFDGSATIGFGKGRFGDGEFGFDADEMGWISGELQTGQYKFGVKVTDRFGTTGNAQQSDEILVIRTAQPAKKLDVDSYDKEQDRLVLGVN